MKLEMSLPDRPGLIHAIPGIDILALVLIFPLLGMSFTSNSGLAIDLPESPHRFKRMERSINVSVRGVSDPKIWVNKTLVSEEQLLEVLKAEAVNWQGGGAVGIVLMVDKQVSSGYKARIMNMLASLRGFKVNDGSKPVTR